MSEDGDEDTTTREKQTDRRLSRRQYLGLAGVGTGSLLTGLALQGGCACRQSESVAGGGPPNPEDWTVVFEDRFDGPRLDTSVWGIGWGWGPNTSMSPTSVTQDNVTVGGGCLRLGGSHEDGQITAGVVNSKNTLTVEPGSYLEARIKFSRRTGFQNAFWAKPNSEAWPPELDVVELWQEADVPDDHLTTEHHLHYPASTEPGDDSTYRHLAENRKGQTDPTESFHVYAAEWRSDRIVHYVDGEPVRTWTDETMLRAMERGAPFYLMFSVNINNIGTADTSEQWDEQMLVDWVRVWVRGQPEHFLWARSADGRPVAFAFAAGGGNIRLSEAAADVDYWVADDGQTAGGRTARTDSLPGFRFEGPIADLAYEGPLELYVDGEFVDPATFVDEDTPGPALDGGDGSG